MGLKHGMSLRIKRREAGQQAGVTLMELLIALAVLSVLTAVATPTFNTLVESWRSRTDTNDMYESLIIARDLVRNNEAVRAIITPINAADWSEGWYTVRQYKINNVTQTDQEVGRFVPDASYTISRLDSGVSNITFFGPGKTDGGQKILLACHDEHPEQNQVFYIRKTGDIFSDKLDVTRNSLEVCP
jgi:prepilin-type N-terminal cleavage/methylation domain-containing protein